MDHRRLVWCKRSLQIILFSKVKVEYVEVSQSQSKMGHKEPNFSCLTDGILY